MNMLDLAIPTISYALASVCLLPNPALNKVETRFFPAATKGSITCLANTSALNSCDDFSISSILKTVPIVPLCINIGPGGMPIIKLPSSSIEEQQRFETGREESTARRVTPESDCCTRFKKFRVELMRRSARELKYKTRTFPPLGDREHGISCSSFASAEFVTDSVASLACCTRLEKKAQIPSCTWVYLFVTMVLITPRISLLVTVPSISETMIVS
mmetsp:Transcript_30744/g.36545  ORF Transcript_30744/g.36545 Transcript_30744/m.36545 type:complete len:216 (-) Transcript_30744:588-1235(-)